MNIFDMRIRNAPRPLKMLIAGYLLSFGMAYVYAIGNILLVVGWTPRDIAIHYYGADAVIQAEKPATSGEESFSLDEVATEPAKPQLGPRPSFKNLVQEGHFHLFGMTSIFFGLTILGLFTSVREPWKTIMVGLPYIAIIADNLSFMATRFLGPHFAYLTALSGAFMGICFTGLWVSIGLELFKKENA